ncbi:hypothetical protein RHO14_02610 [Orbus wheelerorum]|uniref:hypothetical protein n=1 Tax=Orbus wheelerorum TaxID=3074111 RepID=UPI00370DA344
MLILIPITFQNDTFYTIKIGQQIAEKGLVPIDDFTFLDNLPYTYPHWLYDYGIFQIYQIGGFKAIYISSIIFAMILAFLLMFISYRISKNRFVTFFVVCATIMTLSINFTARAQLITYILLIIEYGVLFAYSQKKLSRVPFFLSMMIISTLIVNLHCAIWLLYFLIAIPFVVEKIISGYLIKKPYPLSERIIAIPTTQYSAIFVLITLIASILTGFLTPLGDTPFTYLIKTYRGISTLMISEHQPLAPVKNIAFMVFILEISYLLLFTRCKVFVSELLLLAGLCFLTLLSIRQSAILLLINALIAPRLLTQAFEEQCPKRLAFYTRNIGTIKGGIIALIIISLLCYAHYLYALSVSKITPFTENETTINFSQNYDDNYPVKAMDYLMLNADPTTARIYSDYALGSYVLFRGFKPMLDSRADLYTIEFNNKQDYIKEVAKLIAFQIPYEEFFKKFNINYILLAKNDSLNSYINYDNKYQTIYEDKEFIIYQR